LHVGETDHVFVLPPCNVAKIVRHAIGNADQGFRLDSVAAIVCAVHFTSAPFSEATNIDVAWPSGK